MARTNALDISDNDAARAYKESKTIAFTGAAGLGAVGTIDLFTVTGDVLITSIVGMVTESLAGASATLVLGTSPGTTTNLFASTTATNLLAGDVYYAATHVAGAAATNTSPFAVNGNSTIQWTVGTANITDGTIVMYVTFIPLSADGDVRAV